MSRVRGLILVLICLAAMWGGGLIRFAGEIPASVNDAESETDAIAVLTGGSQRLETGAQLLTIGKAKKLFISGVYHGVDAAELMKPLGTTAETIACCVVLGHGADNTRGNAVETAAWMRDQGFHSLRHLGLSHAAQPAGIHARDARYQNPAEPGLRRERQAAAMVGVARHGEPRYQRIQ